MNIKDKIEKAKAKFKFYYSLNYEFTSLRKDLDLLIQRPPWLPLFNQDRFRLMELLAEERKSAKYQEAFNSQNPLVSVRIATYNNSEELINRAIASVIKQTYKNWEIVIVGDYCTDDTEEKVKELKDPRIHFTDLSYHYPYPEYEMHRWMAQGLLAHNEAVKLCKGSWLAPLDDDNEFLPYHIEALLEKAKREKLELVYGNMISIDRETGQSKKVGGFPPQVGNFDFSACLYHQSLKVFPFDINSYLYQEVGDTNLMRRYKESGVKMGFLNKYVTKYYFRLPGSPRTHETYPVQKGAYPLILELKDFKGALPLKEADLLIDTLVNTTGRVVLIGDDNSKLTQLVKVAFNHNLVPNTTKFEEINDQDKKFKGEISFLIVNSQFRMNKQSLSLFKDLIIPGGLIYLDDKHRDVSLEEDNFFMVDEGLFMRI